MARTIVFVGNCQLGVLADLYRRLVPPNDLEDQVVYVASYEIASNDQKRVLAAADVMVQQVLDFAPKIGNIDTHAAIHLVPHLSGAFLWPCTGQQHPKNARHRYSDDSGPYAAELGDTFLNRMILDGVDPEEAVSRYMNADIATIRRVSRLYELVLDKQHDRDRICGYNFAQYIDDRFRTERIFRSPNHPNRDLTLTFAAEVFRRMGVTGSISEQIRESTKDQLFPPTEMPLHPSVIAHFGLTYVNLDTRYRFADEGSYTTAEYAGRYMRYEWNPLLGEGYELARDGALDRATDVLQRALTMSPRSPAGHNVLSGVHFRAGRLKEAVDMAAIALSLEPTNEHYAGWHARMLSEYGSRPAV